MKCISWNVNGLRACLGKGFEDFFHAADADFFCLQEHKLSPGVAEFRPAGYHAYYSYAQKKGYSGTAIFTRHEPLQVQMHLPGAQIQDEGRIIALEYPTFWFVTAYVPNSQDGLARLELRLQWEEALRAYLCALDAQKPVLYCGDLNVAATEIDLKNPKTNRNNAGFTDQERAAFASLLGCGFLDTFRTFYPDARDIYSWWSYRFRARQNNAGWRIDYFLASARLQPQLRDAAILTHVLGSDHCPVQLDVDLPL